MKRAVRSSTYIIMGLLALSSAQAQVLLSEQQISLDAAQTVATATLEQCRADGYQVSVAVLDRGGNLRIALRDDGAGLHTVDSARRKAYTALTFRTPSSEFAGRVADTPALTEFEGVLALGGGLPIEAGDEVVGAVGVGGAPGGDLDEACAQAGLTALQEALQ